MTQLLTSERNEYELVFEHLLHCRTLDRLNVFVDVWLTKWLLNDIKTSFCIFPGSIKRKLGDVGSESIVLNQHNLGICLQ